MMTVGSREGNNFGKEVAIFRVHHSPIETDDFLVYMATAFSEKFILAGMDSQCMKSYTMFYNHFYI